MTDENKMIRKSAAIIGVGITGITMFTNLVRQNCYNTYYLIDENLVNGGMAFNTINPLLTLNTSNAVISLFHDDLNDMCSYLENRGIAMDPMGNVPRFLIERYAKDRLLEYEHMARLNGCNVNRHYSNLDKIFHKENDTYCLLLNNGEKVLVQDIFICIGVCHPIIPPVMEPFKQQPHFIPSPYPDKNITNLVRFGSRVLILGTHTTAIDAFKLVQEKKCKITMASPSGTLPTPRLGTPMIKERYITTADEERILKAGKYRRRELFRLILRTMEKLSPLSWREQIASADNPQDLLLKEVEILNKGHNKWQNLIVEVTEVLNRIAKKMLPEEKDEFIEMIHSLSGRLLHSIPPPSVKLLLKSFEDKTLTVRKSQMKTISPTPAIEWRVVWQDGEEQFFDYVIGAIGFKYPHIDEHEFGYKPSWDPGKNSIIKPSDNCRVVSKKNMEEERIWLVGPSLHQLHIITLFQYATMNLANSIIQQIKAFSHETSPS